MTFYGPYLLNADVCVYVDERRELKHWNNTLLFVCGGLEKQNFLYSCLYVSTCKFNSLHDRLLLASRTHGMRIYFFILLLCTHISAVLLFIFARLKIGCGEEGHQQFIQKIYIYVVCEQVMCCCCHCHNDYSTTKC